MKNLIRLLSFSLLFVFSSIQAQDISQLTATCAAEAGGTFMKEFPVKLDASTPGAAANNYRVSLLLSKNTRYKFSVCSAPDSEGEAVLQLFDMNKLLGTTFLEATGKDFQQFEFVCQKTAVYHVFIHFKEGRAGEAVGILSLMGQL